MHSDALSERDEETMRIIGARWATETERVLYRKYLGNLR